MAQIGSAQGISVPVIGTDSDVDAATKLVNALNTIIGAVEGQVPISALDWNAGKSAGNNYISQVKYLGLQAQSTSGVLGVIENRSGDLYWTNAAGDVQLTTGASLNAAGIGGIVGDYGGGNPAKVTFVDASNLYEFTTDPGVYADIKATRYIITGSGSGTTILDSAATAAGQVWTLPALPASQLVLQVDAAGTVVATNTIPVAVTLSGGIANNVSLSAGATVAAGQTIRHGDKKERVSHEQFVQISGTGTVGPTDYTFTATGDVALVLPLEVGTRLKGVTVRINKSTASATGISVYKKDDAGAATLLQAGSTTTTGWQTFTVTLGTPENITDSPSTRWYFTLNSYNTDVVASVSFTYDRTT